MASNAKDSLDYIDVANSKTLDSFITSYLPPREQWTSWTHPTTNVNYIVTLQTAQLLSEDDFEMCFNLIAQTSMEDYKKSQGGWKPRSKRNEMNLLDLKYFLIKRDDALDGFISFMPTYEDDCPVIYCYEIHLSTALHGSGLAKILMGYLDAIGARIPSVESVMLTCFTRNERALRFYEKLGYTEDEFSPPVRVLRDGTQIPKEYIILSKGIAREARPKVAEILAHHSYRDVTWNLVPSQSGALPVAAGRGGPFNLEWEVHGTGDIKLVLVMGLGSIMSSWQRQVLKFGHDEGEKYSVLIFDNRGIGKSDKPLMRYSTSEMAKDTVEILDHLGWTQNRQLHVTGVSMGGMIIQELALQIPNRICSLNLISTAAALKNTTGFFENLLQRTLMFVPKSLDRSVTDGASILFSPEWLAKPDDTVVPTTSSPNVIMPESGAYGKFATNFERFAAQELTKRLDTEAFQKKGFMMQAIAAGWHHKTAAQLKQLADAVGRERIMVLHGTMDKMITVPHGRDLIEMLQPGVGIIREGPGHVMMLEDWLWHNEMIETQIEKTEKLSKN